MKAKMHTGGRKRGLIKDSSRKIFKKMQPLNSVLRPYPIYFFQNLGLLAKNIGNKNKSDIPHTFLTCVHPWMTAFSFNFLTID
jgi:hypothetical protein